MVMLRSIFHINVKFLIIVVLLGALPTSGLAAPENHSPLPAGLSAADWAQVHELLPDMPENQQTYIKASNTGSNDGFGWSLSLSGDTLVVGTMWEDSNTIGINGNQADDSAPDSGAVYVFTRSGTTWSQQAYIKASNTEAGDNFGTSVAISGDTLAVGAKIEDSNATGINGNQVDNSAPDSGAVYVFTRSGTTWSQQAYIKASNTEAGDNFGISLALSNDTLAVGAMWEDSGAAGINGIQADDSAPDSGAVYIFTRSGTTWSQQAYIKASNTGLGDNFGISLALSSDTLAVGAYFEDSNATGINGNQAYNLISDSGAVYIFTRSGTTWSQQAYVKASNTGSNDNFGISVALLDDTLAVGASGESSNAISIDGDQTNNSCTRCGAVYVFTRSGTTWSQQAYIKASNTDYNARFGSSLSFSEGTLAVGAWGKWSSDVESGAVYVFTRSGATWNEQTYIKASNTQAYDKFGSVVSLSDGTLAVGAVYESSNASGINGNQTDNSSPSSGATYVFEDVDAPAVLSFAAIPPLSKNSLDIPITAFTASDNIGVTGYLISTGEGRPSADATGWTTSVPTIYTASDYGNYPLSPWVKDAAGNVSILHPPLISINVCGSEITVTSNADSGPGTLRKAIADACSDATITFDNALSAQTIHLNSTLYISRNLIIDGSTLPSPITISGDSDNNGTGDVRVFEVGSTTEMKNLIITKGYLPLQYGYSGDGAGIFNSGGTLTLVNSTVSDSYASDGAGIYSYSTLTLINSKVVNNSTGSGNNSFSGGGIYNDGILTIINSTIANNYAVSRGGGIYNGEGKPLTIQNSTFSENSGRYGGGIFIYSSTAAITNSTFSGNSALRGGGGISNAGLLILRNSTFSGNSASTGGGINNNGSGLDYANTIIANSSGGDCADPSNLVSANINNLVEDGSCSATFSGDPNLGPLADNGGPTQTLALLANSPAIDAGDNNICAALSVNFKDQRGVARPNGSHCDIGAYEYEDTTVPTISAFTATSPSSNLNIPITAFTASDDGVITAYMISESATPPTIGNPNWTTSAPTNFTVANAGSHTLYPWAKDGAGNVSAVYGSPYTVSVCLPAITVTNTNDSGAGSLRQAITNACSTATINFAAGLSGTTIYLQSTLTINNPMGSYKYLTIDGSSLASQITLSGDSDNDGDGDVRMIQVDDITNNAFLNITLNNLTFTKGQASGHGGAILSWAYLTITNSTFSNNSATGTGGAINTNRPLTITNSTFSDNSSTGIGAGGGAIMDNSALTISGSTFSGNTSNVSNSNGGAIYIMSNKSATITNSTFSGNSAAAGGTILTVGDLTITNSTISGNTAAYASFVSGLDIEGGATNLSNTIIGNSLLGLDCLNNSDIDIRTNNLIEDGTCSPTLSGDPNLGVLANNGGPTQTFALLAGSKALEAGDDATCAAAPVSNKDQRGITRPNGSHCDIGAYEYVDTTAPTVTAFTATSLSKAIINITAFTGSDDVKVTGYKITESATPPSVGAAGWTASAPTTYTAVGGGTHSLYPWLKDGAGNVSAVYGSPATVSVDSTAPTALSITSVSTNPTAKVSVQFLVTFSEAVTGLTTTDFSLTTTGNITGSSITSVSAGTTTYTVTVNTGSGDGTLRLNIPNTATITDLNGNALSSLPFLSGQVYTINKTLIYTSTASQDGWIQESSETSGLGGTIDSSATNLVLGDAANKRQYLSVLSFNTGSIPDNATITGVTLKVRQQSIIGGGNPVTALQGFMLDLKTGFFGTFPALQALDFQAAASKTIGPASVSPVSSVYNFNLLNSISYINKLSTNNGLTQIRLRFKLDDDNNALANYLSLYSGDATSAADRPQLIVTYTTP